MPFFWQKSLFIILLKLSNSSLVRVMLSFAWSICHSSAAKQSKSIPSVEPSQYTISCGSSLNIPSFLFSKNNSYIFISYPLKWYIFFCILHIIRSINVWHITILWLSLSLWSVLRSCILPITTLLRILIFAA